MDDEGNVPQLVDKKGGSYSAIAPRLEPRKFNRWKKRMLCYLIGMEPYYIKYIKDGSYQPKTVEDDIMESVISCETTKSTWINLVHSFEENSDNEADERTSEEHVRDLELEFHERALLENLKYKGLVAETFDWDEEEVSSDYEMTQVKVPMALVDDELAVGKNHARNGEWIDITMRMVNILLFMDEDSDWQTYLKYININLKFVEE
ncbi:hypothetical protein Tco_1085457 [Tanacetum coccineum]